MKYNVTLGDKVYEVEVERGEAALVSVSDVSHAPAVVAAPVTAAPAAVAPAPAAPTASVPAGVSGEPIKAPLPGVVLNIKVNSGDSVSAGTVLIVLEAMKMENEIVAPRDGKVTHVAVSKGSSVETGTALMYLS